jgi:hypothetical protein
VLARIPVLNLWSVLNWKFFVGPAFRRESA